MVKGLRLVVTGSQGQVVRALQERGPHAGVEIIALGRPQLDLLKPAAILSALEAARPDVVVSAAAYTAVDLAESQRPRAQPINAVGAGEVARAAAQARRAGRASVDRLCVRRRARSSRIARTIRPARSANTAAASSPANRPSRLPTQITRSCEPPGSTARSARILCGPCSISRRRARKSLWSPTSMARRPALTTSPMA